MLKRKASEAPEAWAAKRLLVEAPLTTDYEHEDDDYDDATSQSGDTVKAETVITATTAASTRSRKFPSDLKTIPCTYPDCDKTFNRPARLAAHLRSHTDDRPFKCTHGDCDKAYREEKHLRQHVKGSHTQERSYTCTTDGCGKSFLTATRLRRHQDVHAGQERFRCRDFPPCSMSFRKHNTLQRHIRAVHEGGPSFVCTEQDCNAGFDSQGALRNHIKRDHSEVEFWCDECAQEKDEKGRAKSVGFTTLSLLQTHIRKEHLSCIFCDQKCKGQGELEKHVELHHSGIPVEARKTICCTWDGCDKKFTKKNNLNAHIRSVHEGFRFVCGQVGHDSTEDLASWSNNDGCGSGFVTKANLELHIRHVHLGIERQPPTTAGNGGLFRNLLDDVTGTKRNISCTVPGCPESFVRSHDLQVHLDTHIEPVVPVLEPIEAEILRLAEVDDELSISEATRPMPELPFLGLTQAVVFRSEPTDIISTATHTPMTEEGEEIFWIGAGAGADVGSLGPEHQSEIAWRQDEADMRALIDDDFKHFIDPTLGAVEQL